MSTNHYQLSVVINPTEFGIDAYTISKALQLEHVKSSSERMSCLADMDRLKRRCKAGTYSSFRAHLQSTDCKAGSKLPVSRFLAGNSLTLPISNNIDPETVKTICECVESLHVYADAVMDWSKAPKATLSALTQPADIPHLESKLRNYIVVPVIDPAHSAGGMGGSVHLEMLVPLEWLCDHHISIDALHDAFVSRREWNLDEEVLDGLFVQKKSRSMVILDASSVYYFLAESGSSADVGISFLADGRVEVCKSCTVHGIDGNGMPWLRMQHKFLTLSEAVQKSGLFVKPCRLEDSQDKVTIHFPYVASHSAGEMAFAGMGPDALLRLLSDVMGAQALHVWTKGGCKPQDDFIENAHFRRMERRLEIAYQTKVPELQDIMFSSEVKLNGKQLPSFVTLLQRLRDHPLIKNIGPSVLTEIHGDLNIQVLSVLFFLLLHKIHGSFHFQNILCLLEEPAAETGLKKFMFIDPRGVVLLNELTSETGFERGDYAYDLSKILFSLEGFAEIRKVRLIQLLICLLC